MPDIVWEDGSIVVFKKDQGEDSEELATVYGYFPVHRLDRETGGLLVMAKNKKAASIISEEIRKGSFRKEYLAVLEGETESSGGRYEDFLFHDRIKNKTFTVKSQRAGVKRAILDYSVKAVMNGLFLAKITLVTGRTHQIRAQFASRGTPVYGDLRYGSKNKANLALWSHKITFTHPVSGKSVMFLSNPPLTGGWESFADTICGI